MMIDSGKNSKLIVPIVIAGSLVSTLGQGVMTVALPKVMSEFAVNVAIAQWLTNIYLLFLGIMIPCTGYLMKRFSSKNLFLFADTLFTLGCLISMFAGSFAVLIFSRIVQAVGAGILLPLVQVVIFRIYPKDQRGKLMGVVGLVISAGPALGQILAGFLTDAFGWRSIFIALGAISLLCIIAAVVLLRQSDDQAEDAKATKLDVPSILLSTLGFGGLVSGATNIGKYGFRAMQSSIPLAVGIVFTALFIIRQLKVQHPLLELRVFKNRNFTKSAACIALVYGNMIGFATLSAVYIQTVRGFSATTYSLLILPGTVIVAVLNPLAGKILDKHGPHYLSIAGTLLITIGGILMSLLGKDSSFLYFGLSYSVQVVGVVGLLQPLATWSVNNLEPVYTEHGTAIINTARQVGGAIVSAILVAIMSGAADNNYMKGIHTTCIVSISVFFVLMILAIFFIPKKEKNQI
ncbi:MAG TPA: DHA2 family efflux MFS transporter permease subunit [Anaerovoracaceae bacterium]|nr:DHA2 family efflux MFS transporter permease subunit [Anaerovoracaceae bacterium]